MKGVRYRYLKAGELASCDTDEVNYAFGYGDGRHDWHDVVGFDGHLVSTIEADSKMFRRRIIITKKPTTKKRTRK